MVATVVRHDLTRRREAGCGELRGDGRTGRVLARPCVGRRRSQSRPSRRRRRTVSVVALPDPIRPSTRPPSIHPCAAAVRPGAYGAGRSRGCRPALPERRTARMRPRRDVTVRAAWRIDRTRGSGHGGGHARDPPPSRTSPPGKVRDLYAIGDESSCSSRATASRPTTSCTRRRSPTRAASSRPCRRSGSTGWATSPRTTCSPRRAAVSTGSTSPGPGSTRVARGPHDALPAHPRRPLRVRRPRAPRRLGLGRLPRTGSVCGVPLPSGLREAEELPEPIFTPATKAAERRARRERAVRRDGRALGAPLAEELRRRSLAVHAAGAAHAASVGLILADTKLEFGLVDDGAGGTELLLIDEVLTPDSSRYWPADRWAPGWLAAELRQAVRARPRQCGRLGPRPPPRRCPTRSSRRPVRATWRPTSGSRAQPFADWWPGPADG
jgi:hypothetical protein